MDPKRFSSMIVNNATENVENNMSLNSNKNEI